MGRRFLISLALVLSTCVGLLDSATSAVAQDEGGLQGNSYTDSTYGFFVEWDAGLFDAEEMVGDDGVAFGVYLIGEYITASIAAAGYSDLGECLEDRVARLEAIDGVSNLRESSRADPLEFDRDVTGGVYQYRYLNPDTGDTDTFVTYFGCEPLLIDDEPQTDVVLTHDFGTPLDMFEDLAPEWVSLVNGVVFAGATGDSTRQTDNDSPPEGGLSGNRYVDPAYAFGIAWDDDLFEAEEILDDGVPVGVNISGDAAFGTAVTDSYRSLRSCLNGRSGAFEEFDGISDLEEAEDLDLPETEPDARALLLRYMYTDEQTGESAVFIQYIECREILVDGEPVEDVYLVFEFASRDVEWDGAVPLIEDVLGSVEWDVPIGSDDDATPPDDETGVSGNRYVDPTDGWAVEWDDSLIEGAELTPAPGSDGTGLTLTSEGTGVMVFLVKDARTARSCLNDEVDSASELLGIEFAESGDVDLPETGDGVRAELFEGEFDLGGGEIIDFYLYVECRPLIVGGEEVEDRFLIVSLTIPISSYEDELPAWSAALLSIEFDAGGTSDDPAPDDPGESGIDGSSYTSNIGYRISWDDAVYTGELLDEENPNAGLNLSSDTSFLTFQVVSDPSVEACVEAEASTVEELGGMGRLSPSREDVPNSPRGSASEIYDSVLTFNDGSEAELVIYLECRPMGDDSPLFLVIRMISFADAYEDELPLWQELLDGIEIIGPDL